MKPSTYIASTTVLCEHNIPVSCQGGSEWCDDHPTRQHTWTVSHGYH